MTKISIIIPAYNAEKHIIKCLESIIINSKLNKLIEIIIINDCSTDNTKNIVEEFILQHDDITFTVINSIKNKGVSESRNIGIKKSKGKYIYFIDSDDTINPNVLLEMYYHIEKYNEDYCMCRHVRINNDNNIFTDEVNYEKYSNINKNIINGNILEYPQLLRDTCCWVYLIRKDLLYNNNLKFIDVPLEDILFTYYLHHYGKKFGFINKIGYYYYDNSEGLTNKYTINDKKTIINNVLTVLKDDEIDEEYKFYVGYYSLLFLPFDYTYNITNLINLYSVFYKTDNPKKFDIDNDEHLLISLGDLLDRGPKPLECLNFINSIPDSC